ncbi:MAG: glycine dehydrogenase (aminomethyl-transferring) [candidate division Zixibacteria bacterium RBG_16_53_22]|nr:MAG: glycine dehydrogenase (aminomethyl-transferring) [candidate division Zixibacteria bacterium RBG_16_53_22]
MSLEYDKLIFDLSSPGTEGISLPPLDVPNVKADDLIPRDLLRKREPDFPMVSEPEVMRHFVALSLKNHHIDKGFYPLGSCTMKYNPKINEKLARLPAFTEAHPNFPETLVQGTLQILYELSEMLKEIAGMDAVTLQPAAGAHGEFTALLMIRAYHEHNKHTPTKVVLPDSAHGTNPASVAMAGFEVIQIPSNSEGRVDLSKLAEHCNGDLAAFMLTNPNTLGLYEMEIKDIAKLVHNCGSVLYMDGANLNALLGIARPGDLGFDIVHFNTHKTFSTPHGGGGPGAGALGVKAFLEPFLPAPIVAKKPDKKGNMVYNLDYNRPLSIGPVHGFHGNTANLIRAYCYIRHHGGPGLREIAEAAIINANYLRSKLSRRYDLPFAGRSLHEFVLSGNRQKALGVKTLDIAKRILDFGIHAPTIYFPLIVPEALMIEPTESESKVSLDNFVEVMLQIADEAEKNPDLVKGAPYNTPVSRLDEAAAAREPDVCYSC